MDIYDIVSGVLRESNLNLLEVSDRTFPGEHWVIANVPDDQLTAAQLLSGQLEDMLENIEPEQDVSWTVVFRGEATKSPLATDSAPTKKGRLFGRDVDQLIQLLTARSRTSDALPSLDYVEDPRASLAAIGASRHHLVYGRRGVGKTALLLEAKKIAQSEGHATTWVNTHTVRDLSPAHAFIAISKSLIESILQQAGKSNSQVFENLRHLRDEAEKIENEDAQERSAASYLSRLNAALRACLRGDLLRVYLYLDDFYLYPFGLQPRLLDYLAGALRDADGWIKVASIERLTRPWEPSSRTGLEVPHDASIIDIDMTLEAPEETQRFLESVLSSYTTRAGIKSPSSLAKPEALGRLVLASGGVPRDYLNLFAASIVVARSAREGAREVGKEDVAVAAGNAARAKKRDLDQDVVPDTAPDLLSMLEKISSDVRGQGFTYFRVDLEDRGTTRYELLLRLVDLRFAHLVKTAVSDQHRPGVRYDAYTLDLSQFAEIRLQRGLNILDLVAGKWTWILTGQGRKSQTLTDTQLRDRLRNAPLVKLKNTD